MQPRMSIFTFLLFCFTSLAVELCDGSGYDLGHTAYFYLEDANLSSESNCGNHCRADTKCKSFAVGNDACLHYDVNVATNARGDDESPWKFFDRSCVMTTISSSMVLTSTDPAYLALPTRPIAAEHVTHTESPMTTVIEMGSPLPTGPSQTGVNQAISIVSSPTSTVKVSSPVGQSPSSQSISSASPTDVPQEDGGNPSISMATSLASVATLMSILSLLLV